MVMSDTLYHLFNSNQSSVTMVNGGGEGTERNRQSFTKLKGGELWTNLM